jgi:L-alanine-DL-glutamate epimerase-like enolase superfamily enzyme
MPEADGTFVWDSTTLVTVEVTAGNVRGLGYTYGDPVTARLIAHTLAPVIVGLDVLDVPRAWDALVRCVRNLGRPGLASLAISAIDVALWDAKAKLLDVSLARLLGMARSSVSIYGSGGFTSYTDAQLTAQLEEWRNEGVVRMKIKVGTEPDDDPRRIHLARETIGDRSELFVDANGAYTRKQALVLAGRFAEDGVGWFEEPVSSDDLDGLHLIRDRAPSGMAIAAGEYGFDPPYFRRMLSAGAVDVLQADATRCLGITGFLRVGALCEAFGLPLSAHCAPALHLALCCALPSIIHMEWFHDHARIESMLFDGAPTPHDGMLVPDLDRPGLGLELRRADAERFAA